MMSDGTVWRYRAALLASTISVFGWLGAVGGTFYTIAAALSGGSVARGAVFTGAAVLVGAAFAKLESSLYDGDESALARIREERSS